MKKLKHIATALKILFIYSIVFTKIAYQEVYASDFRDPQSKQFSIWPNIPVISASDFEEYELDRKTFTDLHKPKDPSDALKALAAVDTLQSHHEKRSVNALGRSFNAQLIAMLDNLARTNHIETPKLRFSFNDISPADIQRSQKLDETSLNKLKSKASQITLVMYLTYTKLEKSNIQITCTVVKLQSGDSESFSVADHITHVSATLAQALFNYFYGNRLSFPKNPMSNKEWLPAAPNHTDKLASREQSEHFCKSQNGALPTIEEIETGEALGSYHGGIFLKPNTYYHTKSGLYLSSETSNPLGRNIPNIDHKMSNGYYYCIRKNKSKK